MPVQEILVSTFTLKLAGEVAKSGTVYCNDENNGENKSHIY